MSMAGLTARKGAPVTFTHLTAGAYDAATDTTASGTAITVPGHAMQIDGDPDLYTALSLIESDSPTLFFVPSTPGVIPALGYSVAWGGETLTVKNVKPLAMAGTPTAARIVVGR